MERFGTDLGNGATGQFRVPGLAVRYVDRLNRLSTSDEGRVAEGHRQ
jgi:hypothetical protein